MNISADQVRKLHRCQIETNKGPMARMIDLLLANVFGKGMFFARLDKRSNIVTFEFWADEAVFNAIMEVMRREMDEMWDEEYESLLEDS